MKKAPLSQGAIEQIAKARELGKMAWTNQTVKKCVPAWDSQLSAMLEGRRVGEEPEGEASTIDLLKAWSEGFLKQLGMDADTELGRIGHHRQVTGRSSRTTQPRLI
jgi:hypothetical protein